MADWTQDELNKIGAAEELHLGLATGRWDAALPRDDVGCAARR